MREGLRALWALIVVSVLTILGAVLGVGCGGKDEDVKPLYGPPPTDGGERPDGCTPNALYGPLPCGSDADCVTQMGAAGWYCEQVNLGDDGCGKAATWPACVKRDVPDAGPVDAGPAPRDACAPVPLYGPRQCQADADCGDAGQVCDQDNTFSDGCGGQVRWPVCR